MRLPPSENRFNRKPRSRADDELAARMIQRLKEGKDVRSDRITESRQELNRGGIDDAHKLDVAMDRLLDELEAEIEATEFVQAQHLEKIEALQIQATPKVMYLISRSSRKPPVRMN